MRRRLLVIGAGMATAYLLQELMAAGHDYDITVVSAEAEPCYNRILLSGVIAGECPESDLQMLAPQALTSGARFLTRTWVSEIDIERREVVTERYGRLGYEQLVIATGASVARPDLAVTGVRGIHSLRTLQDCRELRERATDSGSAVVLGGGLLGLEAAHGLAALGYRTTVVHRHRFPMNRQLDREGGLLLQRQLQAQGIEFALGTNITALHSGESGVRAVELGRGAEQLPCDLLLFATGITPNAALAAAAGVATDRGVLIDSQLNTSAENVSALGECSQLGDDCFGLVAPIRKQARVLCQRLLGQATGGFTNEHWPTQLKISGIDIFSAGNLSASGDELVLRDAANGVYRRLVLRDNKLVGAVLVGDKRGGNWYSELIREGSDVAGFRSALMFGREFGRAMQMTAQAA